MPRPIADLSHDILEWIAVGRQGVAPMVQLQGLFFVLVGGAELVKQLVVRDVVPVISPPANPQKDEDRWMTPKEGAQRLGISVRTLSRWSTKPPYVQFCIPQARGFKVSEAGLSEYMRSLRGAVGGRPR